jgi:hypothetical protein
VSVAAISGNASSSTWVLDSGASFHVTSYQSQLDTCATVTNESSVQTADGTSALLLTRAPSVPPIFLYLIFLLYLSSP